MPASALAAGKAESRKPDAAQPAGPVENSSGGQPPLCGRYRVFFRPEVHPTVSKWYNETAGSKQRHAFKRLVKAISNFDVAEAKRKLRIGFNLDIPNANALVAANGARLLSDEARQQAVYYLAQAPPAERQAYRESIGLIEPPSLTCLHQSRLKMDFAEDRKYMKGELMHRDMSKPIVGKEQLRMQSTVVDADCQVIGDGKSQYGLFYAWKVAPKLSTNVTQRAHDSSTKGAPWGEYGSAEKNRWVTHATEDAEDREYGAPDTVAGATVDGARPLMTTKMPKRRFQNYNDNLSHEMYRTQRLLRKGRSLPGDKVKTVNEKATTAPDIMRPQRAPVHAGEAYSPIFCR